MKTDIIKSLREKAKMTQAEVAAALGITTRTISSWEVSMPPRQLSAIETQALRDLFMPNIIEPTLLRQSEEVFQSIPSELVAFWLIHGTDCLLLPSGIRLQDLKTYQRSATPSPRCVASLAHVSLTTHPLRTSETLNLAGDDIAEHPAKKYKNRTGQHFHFGVCESLLHIPAFIPSPSGPQPVFLLCLENKLQKDGRQPIKAKSRQPIYSEADLKRAREFVETSKNELVEDMELLHMI